ncbi:MAG TPA: trypsin-like serine protease [Acidimicrobiia bacterium]|nr:trypsin-like serine protease [Acidimicrobiia bacterium]
MTDHDPLGPGRPPLEQPLPVEPMDTPEPPRTEPRPRVDPWTVILGIFGGVLLGTGVTFAVLGLTGVFTEPTTPTLPPPPELTIPPPAPPPTFGDVVSATDVASRVIPSTVAVEVFSLLGGGSGSGVVYGEEGYLITNDHVVAGAEEVFVVFSDGARYQAEIVGTDPLTDLAVLKVDRPDLVPIAIGSSDDLAIGEPAIAVGNPLGLEGGPTVTMGIVSALDRSLAVSSGSTLFGLIQTDAPIAPGSSGGALVDAAGRLIGITTAIAVSDVGAEGLGFAVPIDLVIGVANDLIERGEVQHALLGIQGDTVWAEEGVAQYPVGVGVIGFPPDSAYEAAGGEINDVIVELNGAEVRTIEELLARLRRLRAGDQAEVRILRSDSEQILTVTLGRR